MRTLKTSLLILLALGTGLVFGFYYGRKEIKTIEQPKAVNARMVSDRIVIIAVDTVDGRPIFNVLFQDEDVMDSMYGEEIGNALATGDWHYDEDLRVK